MLVLSHYHFCFSSTIYSREIDLQNIDRQTYEGLFLEAPLTRGIQQAIQHGPNHLQVLRQIKRKNNLLQLPNDFAYDANINIHQWTMAMEAAMNMDRFDCFHCLFSQLPVEHILNSSYLENRPSLGKLPRVKNRYPAPCRHHKQTVHRLD